MTNQHTKLLDSPLASDPDYTEPPEPSEDSTPETSASTSPLRTDWIYPSFWRRAAANMIDGVILSVFCSAVGCFSESGTEFIGLFFTVVISAVYFISSETQTGQTIGKWCLGYNVFCRRPALRYFCKALSAAPFGAGFLTMFVDSQQRCLHDIIADAIAIRAK